MDVEHRSDLMQTVLLQRAQRGDVLAHEPFVRIVITDDDGDGLLVVHDDFSTLYGTGETHESAIADYADALFEQFDVLDRHQMELAPVLRAELERLRAHFRRVAGR